MGSIAGYPVSPAQVVALGLLLWLVGMAGVVGAAALLWRRWWEVVPATDEPHDGSIGRQRTPPRELVH